MDNRGLSHSFKDRRATRIFVMRDEGMFISRCGKNKKPAGLRAPAWSRAVSVQCNDAPLVWLRSRSISSTVG
jgi:hypothetical protein